LPKLPEKPDLQGSKKTQHILEQHSQMKKIRELELTRIGKQRQLVESVNPFTIFENDSQAEMGSVMSSMVGVGQNTHRLTVDSAQDGYMYDSEMLKVSGMKRGQSSILGKIKEDKHEFELLADEMFPKNPSESGDNE